MTASKIEWTDRSDWNPIRGCTRVSPGCGGPGPHGGCYAEAIAARFSGPGQAFHGYAERTKSGPRWTGRVEVQWERLDLPLRWKKPVKIFASSTSDWFHEALPVDEIANLYAVAVAAVHLRGHTIQILTKRADRCREILNSEAFWDQVNAEAGAYVMEHTDPHNRRSDDARATCDDYGPGNPPPGIWLGVSVEDQARADERIPLLLDTPAAKRFVSAEPLLGPVDLREYLVDPASDWMITPKPAIDWVIAGGESGAGARGANRAWYRSLRDQCATAGVAYFHKQNGEWIDADEWLDGLTVGIARNGERWDPPRPLNYTDAAWLAEACGRGRADQIEHHSDGTTLIRVGKAAAGRLLDGRTWDQFPK